MPPTLRTGGSICGTSACPVVSPMVCSSRLRHTVTKTQPKAVWSTHQIELQTTDAPQFVDLTAQVTRLVAESRVDHGQALVFSKHTTAALTINEHEPELLKDLALFLRRLAPAGAGYCHDDFSVRTVNLTEDEWPNAHAHCQRLLLSTSEAIPVVGGQLQMGRWQSIFLVELDHPRVREVIVQVHGILGT